MPSPMAGFKRLHTVLSEKMANQAVLSQSLYLGYDKNLVKLIKTSHRIAQTFLENNSTENLLEDYKEWRETTNTKPHNFFRQTNKYAPFEPEDSYYYSRFKRCTYALIARQLETHASKHTAFQFLQDEYSKHDTYSALEDELFDQDDFVNYDSFKQAHTEYEKYISKTGSEPSKYTDLNTIRKIPFQLPLAPDDNRIHDLEINENTLALSVKTPDCQNPDSYHDYSETEVTAPLYPHVNELLQVGDACKPTIRLSSGELHLDLPIEINTTEFDSVENKTLACDLGVKTQVTSTVVRGTDENHLHQESRPDFYDHPLKQKLNRIIDNRKNVRTNTPQHDWLADRETNLRGQIQHDASNYLVIRALVNKCSKIILEDLSGLEAPNGLAEMSRQVSSWARGDLLEKIKYKAELVGLEVELVNPYGTSQHCPRCGEHGERVKASNDLTEDEAGGWFYCDQCGFSGDRDYVGSLNVGRMYLSPTDRIQACKPVEYISPGNSYARFVSEAVEVDECRSPSVQPAIIQSEELFEAEAGDECCKKRSGVTGLALSPVQLVLSNHTT